MRWTRFSICLLWLVKDVVSFSRSLQLIILYEEHDFNKSEFINIEGKKCRQGKFIFVSKQLTLFFPHYAILH